MIGLLTAWIGFTVSVPAAGSAIEPVRVFAIYEPVTTPRDLAILLRVRPDLVCRGWFKWHHTPRWSDWQPLAERLHAARILLQGGITCAAIYPRENGIDAATFRDFTTHDPDGQPVKISFSGDSGWYHLSLYNPKVREYLKAEVRKQIDAGAQGVWYDEIEGTYDWLPRTGYDRYAVDAFREWLVTKYVRGQNWRMDDHRWRTVFGVDLSRHGGSIAEFDYRRHLAETRGRDGQPLAANPPQGDPRRWADSPNLLYREWGYAWDRAARGTFRFDTVQRMFDELVADARSYAQEQYGRELIITYNHNGTARPGMEFLQPHHGAQPICHAGRLQGGARYVDWYEKTVADAAAVAPGTPVVFFVDWPAEADRLVALPRGDQLNFLHLYVPEAYAAGGEFALPVRGYSYRADQQDTLAALCRMADFYREHAALFRPSRPAGERVVRLGPPTSPKRERGNERESESPAARASRASDGADGLQNPAITARLRRSAAGTVLHLINHRWNAAQVRPEPWDVLSVDVLSGGGAETSPLPLGAFAVSTEWLEQRPVTVTAAAGVLTLRVPGLNCNTLVVLPEPRSWQKIEGTAGPGCRIQADGRRAQAIADKDGRFAMWLPRDFTGTLVCLETGESIALSAGKIRFRTPAVGPRATGVVLDELGAPLRHQTLSGGGSGHPPIRTDAWGSFSTPCESGGTTLRLPGQDGRLVAVAVQPGVWEVRLRERPVIVDAGQGLLGWWGNWPERGRPGAAEPVQIRLAEWAARPALEIRFLPVATAWVNTNSPAFSPRGGAGIELTCAGDGSRREAVCQVQVFRDNFRPPRAADTFYRCRLSLESTEWTTVRLPWQRFVAADGQRLDAIQPQRIALQVAPAGRIDRDLTVRVHSARLILAGAPVEVRPQP